MAVYIYFAQLNVELFHVINNVGRNVNDSIWMGLTALGNKLVIWTLLFIVAWRFPKLLVTTLLAGIFEIFISLPLKTFFDAARPTDVLIESSYHLIGFKISGYSFPSGHTMSAFAIASAIALYSRNLWVIISILTLASLAGISRIMLGVHWPVDVLVGAALGGLCGYAAIVLTRNFSLNQLKIQWFILFMYFLIASRLLWAGTSYPSNQLYVYIMTAIALLLSVTRFLQLLRS